MPEEFPSSPEEGHSEDQAFSLEDLSEHTVTYGVDIYSAIDPARETSRSHNCFLQLREKYPTLFDTLTAGGQFAISSSFEGSNHIRFPFMQVNTPGQVIEQLKFIDEEEESWLQLFSRSRNKFVTEDEL
jgi:hypothetical protein